MVDRDGNNARTYAQEASKNDPTHFMLAVLERYL